MFFYLNLLILIKLTLCRVQILTRLSAQSLLVPTVVKLASCRLEKVNSPWTFFTKKKLAVIQALTLFQDIRPKRILPESARLHFEGSITDKKRKPIVRSI